ncbi:unnamed protein product [Closterium sp. NIES-53]
MKVALTSMFHAVAPHFLWPLAVRYAAHQLNLWPRISMPETWPTLRWRGKVGDASVFQVWGSRAFVRDTSVDKLSSRTFPCVFLGFPPDAPGWQFYHPTSRRLLPSQDVTFDESVLPLPSLPLPLCLSPPPKPLFFSPRPPPVDPLPLQGLAPSGVSQVDPLPATVPVEVAVDSGATRGAASGVGASGGAVSRGAERASAEPGGAEPDGAEPGGAEPGGVELVGVEPGGAKSEGAASRGAQSWGAELGGTETEGAESWGAKPRGAASAGGPAGSATGGTVAGTSGATSLGGAGAASPGGARTRGTGAAGAGGVGGAGGAGAGGTGAGGAGAGGAGAGDPGVGGAGAGGTGARGTGTGGTGAGGAGAVDPGAGVAGARGAASGGTERRVLESRPASPVCAVCTRGQVPRPCPPPVPGTHVMALRPSSVPLRVPLPPPLESSLPSIPGPDSDLAHAASHVVSRLLATVVTDPSFESTAASALVAELVDFAVVYCLDYATCLVAESKSDCPPSFRSECALGTDVLVAIQLAPEGDADAPDIPTPRSYAEAITGPYSSQWQSAMDAEMASWMSTRTYVHAVPPPGANIIDGMWNFIVKRPPGSPPAFKARYVARGFSQRQGVDIFKTFSPTPKMITLRVLLHVATQRDYELHSLDFNIAFLQGSLHEEI